MTPAELKIYADAFAERVKLDQKVSRVNLYNLALLIRTMVWAKHPPRYETIFPEDQRPTRTMTDEQMFDQVRALNALWGGEEP